MYGKCFESMYEGSMVGAGIHVFAVWNYIITKARAGRVEINPKLLGFTLGGSEKQIEEALEFLSTPDKESRSKLEEGRRIVREGQFQFRLVNWEYYQKIRNEDDRREYNRNKQAEYRAKKKSGLTIRERVVKAVNQDPITKADARQLRRINGDRKPTVGEEEEPKLPDER